MISRYEYFVSSATFLANEREDASKVECDSASPLASDRCVTGSSFWLPQKGTLTLQVLFDCSANYPGNRHLFLLCHDFKLGVIVLWKADCCPHSGLMAGVVFARHLFSSQRDCITLHHGDAELKA